MWHRSIESTKYTASSFARQYYTEELAALMFVSLRSIKLKENEILHADRNEQHQAIRQNGRSIDNSLLSAFDTEGHST